MATASVAESLYARAHRSAARCDLPAAVDVDLDFLLRRSGDAAGAAPDRGGADARGSDADGLVDGDGDRPLRLVLTPVGRVARSSAQAAGVCDRRIVDCVRGGDGTGGMVVRLV